jgi:hypothetical protein
VGANLGIVSVILARRFADRVVYSSARQSSPQSLRQRANACSGNRGSRFDFFDGRS